MLCQASPDIETIKALNSRTAHVGRGAVANAQDP